MGCLLKIFLILNILSSSILFQSNNEEMEDFSSSITIDGDSDLEQCAIDYGWPGNGTKMNPYVISGIFRSHSFINITKNVVIINCTFISSYSPSNLYINNSNNFIINSCMFKNSNYGISINNCMKIEIGNCSFNNLYRSIVANTINSLNVSYCTLNVQQKKTGILINFANNININNNSFINGNGGLSIIKTNNTIIHNNYFFNQSGHSIYQIDIEFSSIQNNTFKSSSGLYIRMIECCLIINNQISNRFDHHSIFDCAIYIQDCTFGKIENNYIDTYQYGIGCDRLSIIVDDCPIIQKNIVISRNAGIVCDNCYVNNNKIINSNVGIIVHEYAHLYNNTLINNSIGVRIEWWGDYPSYVYNNSILSDGNGIGVDITLLSALTCESQISNNTISGFGYGVFFNSTEAGNVLSNNTILNSTISGIRMVDSDGQIIKGNMIQNSKKYGLEMQNSKSNTISDNVFLYNQGSMDEIDNDTIQAIDYSGGNSFSEGGRGNYWRDLNGKDDNMDGIIDEEDYFIEVSNQRDRYPLESPPFPVVSKIPINLTVDGMNPFIEMEWEDGGKEHPLMMPEGYHVYRRPDGTEQFDLIGTTTETSFQDYNVSSEIRYQYSITSFNEFGETPKCEYVIGIVDDREPYLKIYEPWNGSVLSTENVTVKWTAEDIIGKMESIEIKLDGSEWVDVSTEDQYTFTGLEEGQHIVYITGKDKAGNEGITDSNFTIDLNPPVFLSLKPEPGSFTNKTWIECIATGYDNVSDQVHYTFMINGENRSVVNYEGKYNFTKLSEGEQIITVYIHDQAGSFSRKSVTYNIDLTPPVLEWNTTSDLTKEQGLDLTWILNDSYAGISHVLVKGPDGFWKESDTISGHRFVSEEEGTFTVYVEAYDGAGNHALIWRNISFDRTSPSVVDYGPKGENITLHPTFYIHFDEDMKICTWDVDGIRGGFEGVGRTLEFQLDSSLRKDRSYTVTVEGSDNAGNEMDPFTWSFNTTNRGSVRGTVLDLDHDPIPNTIILIDGIGIECGTDGSFQVSLSGGTHSIKVSADGYNSWNTSFDIDPGLELDLGVITLDSGTLMVTITGKVTDSSGSELDYVSIEIKGRVIDTTDGNGMFSFEIEPGIHNIQFSKNGYETKMVTVDTASYEDNPYLEVILQDENGNGKPVNYILIIAITVTLLIVLIIFFYFLTRNRIDGVGFEE